MDKRDYEDLTAEAKTVLLTLYKAYKERLKNETSRSEARHFGGCQELQAKYFRDWSFGDLLDIIRELSKSGWIHSLWGDDVPIYVDLETPSIAFFQSRFKRGLKEVVQALVELKKII